MRIQPPDLNKFLILLDTHISINRIFVFKTYRKYDSER